MSELKRLLTHRNREENWKNWGPYLSERQWGTVREDYIGKHPGSEPWITFPFEDSHSRVYRWGEDGLGGICDRFQTICFAFAFWNGKDPVLKERLFGLGNLEGNHGESVKEQYHYLDATPTSSYLKMLYNYPQREFPYAKLREESKKRGLADPEYQLHDTGIFDENRYFNVFIEHAKENPKDILCRVTIINRGPESAPITCLPTVWFRNTWSWGYESGPTGDEKGKPRLYQQGNGIQLDHPTQESYYFYVEQAEQLLFCDNENSSPYPKDTFHRHIVKGDPVNPQKEGTKGAGLLRFTLQTGEQKTFFCRLTNKEQKDPFLNASQLFETRIKETDDFYHSIQKQGLSNELKNIQRQAFAGLLFSKQFYYLNQHQWLHGDPHLSPHHSTMRNTDWDHLTTFDILSMPDKWEYPYFCSWDSGFHCLAMVLIDPDFAKRQLTLMTREWYMHPNGQFPANEWCFSDVNPPVQAWALFRTYKIDARKYGVEDRGFLEGNFHKLLLNFTWWVNKKDAEGNNIFQGGFLGMDNISIFDRSRDLPTGGHIDQSDGSAWMSFYCIEMMKIAIHLSEKDEIYQDMATKFFEHFLRIARAMSHHAHDHHALWDEEDGFFYDVLHLPNRVIPLKVRSLVGLLPLLAVETIRPEVLEKLPIFKRRMDWFIHNRPDVSMNVACLYEGGVLGRRLLSIVTKEQLVSVLKYMLDEEEFLSPFGIRSISKYHEKHPYIFQADGQQYEVKYVPGDSDNRMFGGNSNWRGPIWFPINFLLIEALQRYHHYYGDELKVEFPTRSGHFLNLWDVAAELSKRLIQLYVADESGKIAAFGSEKHEHLLFYEYFNGDTGKGLGASHQTGWTALITKLIQQSGENL
ncbi:MAG: glucosidase [Verrucomicrobia bacterium]|nr:glucosidase [Verrucomicrobiota bacterium]